MPKRQDDPNPNPNMFANLNPIMHLLPTFSGLQSEDVNYFFTQLEELLKFANLDKKYYLLILKTKLKEKALHYVIGNSQMKVETAYEKFKESLINKFRKKLTVPKVQEEFWKISQIPKQSVVDFSEQVEEASRKYLIASNMDSDKGAIEFAKIVLLSNFIEGLRPDIRLEVKKLAPQTFKDAVNIAVRIENALEDNNYPVNSVKQTTQPEFLQTLIDRQNQQREVLNKMARAVNKIESNKYNARINPRNRFCTICRRSNHNTDDCWFARNKNFTEDRYFQTQNYQRNYRENYEPRYRPQNFLRNQNFERTENYRTARKNDYSNSQQKVEQYFNCNTDSQRWDMPSTSRQINTVLIDTHSAPRKEAHTENLSRKKDQNTAQKKLQFDNGNRANCVNKHEDKHKIFQVEENHKNRQNDAHKNKNFECRENNDEVNKMQNIVIYSVALSQEKSDLTQKPHAHKNVQIENIANDQDKRNIDLPKEPKPNAIVENIAHRQAKEENCLLNEPKLHTNSDSIANEQAKPKIHVSMESQSHENSKIENIANHKAKQTQARKTKNERRKNKKSEETRKTIAETNELKLKAIKTQKVNENKITEVQKSLVHAVNKSAEASHIAINKTDGSSQKYFYGKEMSNGKKNHYLKCKTRKQSGRYSDFSNVRITNKRMFNESHSSEIPQNAQKQYGQSRYYYGKILPTKQKIKGQNYYVPYDNGWLTKKKKKSNEFNIITKRKTPSQI